MNQLATSESLNSLNALCKSEDQASSLKNRRNDSNENQGKSDNEFSHIYINNSDDELNKSLSFFEIPTPEIRIGYSIVSVNSVWSPTNGPSITELHLNNESLDIPDLQINTELFFLPVLKRFTVYLEAKRKTKYRSSKCSKTMAMNISRIFEVLQAPQLESLEFQDDFKERSLMFWKGQQLCCWERPLASFIKDHCVSLKRLSVIAWKSSVPPEIQLETSHPFPELEELSIGFWGYETHDYLSAENNFWVALLKSQSVQLRKLNWCVSCSMSWENIIVPVITKNFNALESIQMLLPIVASDTADGRSTLGEPNYIFSIDCLVFSNATKLKTLHLGWQYCFIHNLHFLPRSLQDFSLLSIPVQSCELISLNNLPELKQLNLIVPKYCRCSRNVIVDITRKEEYGVTPLVLKHLLANRSLMGITANIFPDAIGIFINNEIQSNQSKIYAEESYRRSWWFLIRNWFHDLRSPKGSKQDCYIRHSHFQKFLEAADSINRNCDTCQSEPEHHDDSITPSDISEISVNHLQNLMGKNSNHKNYFIL